MYGSAVICDRRKGFCHTDGVRKPDASKVGLINSFPAGPPDKVGLARIVDADDGRDDAENSFYEGAADPGFVGIETAHADSGTSISVA
jgi:hypothetical protein